jgi:cellulose synthase/poly-beta-1,6-N-acetylglucosamine synthase-like glycosyltransferase
MTGVPLPEAPSSHRRVPLLGMDGGPTPARRLLSRRQWTTLALPVALWIAAAVFFTYTWAVVTLAVTTLMYIVVGGFRAWLVHDAWSRAGEPAPMAPRLPTAELPRYTVLVPLYREANVLEPLVAHLSRLQYPDDRLEVLLICEADDADTIAAIRAAALPGQFRLVVCPDGSPRTKPRACNFGLEQATGDLCVIYDAEDRPSLDQLRRAAEGFAAAPGDVVCLQAPLDYHNHDHNWLTRFFAVEYNFWFDLLLQGLVRGVFPVPLGGTSNHLRVAELRALGGWDPYNVTEDADLGLRLHSAGGRTQMLPSVTLEEACSRLGPWIRQRTRWQKGYLQTWIVHSRDRKLRRRGGLRSVAGMHLLVGGCVVVNLLNPPMWGFTIYFAITRANWVLALFPGFLLYPAVISLVVGNFFFLYANFLAVLHRKRWHLAHAVVLMPFYWLLMSLAAWRAVGQLVTSLHKWEKTPHGLSGRDTDPAFPVPSAVGEAAEAPVLEPGGAVS